METRQGHHETDYTSCVISLASLRFSQTRQRRGTCSALANHLGLLFCTSTIVTVFRLVSVMVGTINGVGFVQFFVFDTSLFIFFFDRVLLSNEIVMDGEWRCLTGLE